MFNDDLCFIKVIGNPSPTISFVGRQDIFLSLFSPFLIGQFRTSERKTWKRFKVFKTTKVNFHFSPHYNTLKPHNVKRDIWHTPCSCPSSTSSSRITSGLLRSEDELWSKWMVLRQDPVLERKPYDDKLSAPKHSWPCVCGVGSLMLVGEMQLLSSPLGCFQDFLLENPVQ